MNKLLTLLTAGLMAGLLSAAVPIPEPATNIYGNLKGNEVVITNQMAINQAIIANLGGSSGRNVIYGDGFDTVSPVFKATLAMSSDVGHFSPPCEYVYLSKVALGAAVYGADLKKMDSLEVVVVNGELHLQGVCASGEMDTWSFESEQINDLLVQVQQPQTYGYSHPNDWLVTWSALADPEQHVVQRVESVTNTAQQIKNTYITETVRNGRAQLIVNYLDEVNMPLFAITDYIVLDGPATIDRDTLTSTGEGIVNVKAIANNGEERFCEVPMFRWTENTSYTRYDADATTKSWGINRKRVDDYIHNLLTTYRSNPTTNRTYTAGGSIQHAYAEDTYTGNFGRRLFPYQRIGVNSAGNVGTSTSHAPISKHLLLAAAHWGGGLATEYFNWDGKFSGQAIVKGGQWVPMANWARQHGFQDTDTMCGDLAIIVLKEGEVPDECLPYIATADYLNSMYGVDVTDPNNTRIPAVSINQANMTQIRGCYMGGSWGSSAAGPHGNEFWTSWDEATSKWISNDKNYNAKYYRYDIFQDIGKGCWHTVVGGDSGHPTYIYDPALTTGLTDTDGTPLLRPILICAYHTAGGSSSSVPKFTKVIKAFADSIGEELPYTLGDLANQSSNVEIIKQNAIDAMNQ